MINSLLPDLGFALTLIIKDADGTVVHEADALDQDHAEALLVRWRETFNLLDLVSMAHGGEGLLSRPHSPARAAFLWRISPIVRHDLDRRAADVFDGEGIVAVAGTAIAYARCSGSRGCGYTDGEHRYVEVTRLGTRADTGQGIWRVEHCDDPMLRGLVLVDDLRDGDPRSGRHVRR